MDVLPLIVTCICLCEEASDDPFATKRFDRRNRKRSIDRAGRSVSAFTDRSARFWFHQRSKDKPILLLLAEYPCVYNERRKICVVVRRVPVASFIHTIA
jgi:hypothetical protein